jgi:RHS repeat-associated protein
VVVAPSGYPVTTWTAGLPKTAKAACGGVAANSVIIAATTSFWGIYCVDSSDRAIAVLDANGNGKQTSWTLNSQASALTNALSSVITLGYDTNNNLNSMVSPASTSGATQATTTVGFSTPNTTTGYQYLPSSVTDPQNGCRAFTYDTVGNLTDTYANQSGSCSGSTGGGMHLTNAYQGDTGVASCTSDGLTTTYKGILCTTTDGNTHVVATNAYTFAASAPKTMNQLEVKGPGAICTTGRKLCQTYTFDAAGRLSTATDSSTFNGGNGEKTTYCYDKADRIVKVFYTAPATTPNCTTGTADIAYTWNADGNLTQRVDGSGTATFGYDSRGRVVTKNTGTNVCTVTLPSGTVINGTMCFGYDTGDNLTSFQDSSGSTSYTYDGASRLTTLVEPGGTAGCAVSPQTLTSLCSAFTYDNADRRTTTQFPGGATLAITYDNAGNELTVIGKSSTNTTLTSFTACYRDLVSGNCPAATPITDRAKMTQVKENDPRATLTADYLHDAAGRLCSSATTAGGTCAAPPAGANKYVYDAAGNRTQAVLSGTTYNYFYDSADRICWRSTTTSASCTAPAGATVYTSDPNGNLQTTTNPTGSFTYNTKGQTTDITAGGVTLSAMAYADVGQSERTSSTQSGSATTFLSSPLGLDKATTGANSTYTVRDSDGNLIGFKDSAGAHWYYLLDNLGSVVAVINSSGSTVANRYGYDEYGQATSVTSTVTQPWRYGSGYLDNTGLYKFGARYYDASLGRWTQPDPIPGTVQNPGTVNRYLYVGDDPVNDADPAGTCGILSCVTNAISSAAGAVGSFVSDHSCGLMAIGFTLGGVALFALVPLTPVGVLGLSGYLAGVSAGGFYTAGVTAATAMSGCL